jgi:hypothetical protein
MFNPSLPLLSWRTLHTLKRARAIFMLYFALGGAIISGCASHPATAATGTPDATPAATVTPRVLYQSDFTHHASEWALPPTWRVAHGVLVNNGDSTDTINLVVPYIVTEDKYTIIVVMQTLAAKGQADNDMYGILGQTPGGRTLYTAAMTAVERTLHSYTLFYPAVPDPNVYGNNAGASDYTPGTNPQPYTIQVDGSRVNFIAGDGEVGDGIQSAEQLAPARFVIQDQSMQMTIESVTITTP